MKRTRISLPILAWAAALTLSCSVDRANAGPYTISPPAIHDNLAIYLVHGASSKLPTPMTLDEALSKKLVRVIETSDVNQLAVENLGRQTIFIQSGDVVTGGKQDRLLVTSLLLPPRSGRLPIAAFCVEPGRWSPRAGEGDAAFSAAADAVGSRRARVVMYQSLAAAPISEPVPSSLSSFAVSPQADRQVEMWQETKAMQNDLSRSLKTDAEDPRSPTSLALTLSDQTLKAKEREYIDALRTQALQDNDVLGFVVTVNGRISSGEIYASNGLFREMWPKMLRAATAEAIRSDEKSAAERPAPEDIEKFLQSADAGSATQQKSGVQSHRDSANVARAFGRHQTA